MWGHWCLGTLNCLLQIETSCIPARSGGGRGGNHLAPDRRGKKHHFPFYCKCRKSMECSSAWGTSAMMISGLRSREWLKSCRRLYNVIKRMPLEHGRQSSWNNCTQAVLAAESAHEIHGVTYCPAYLWSYFAEITSAVAQSSLLLVWNFKWRTENRFFSTG